ncbi:hypothetical protein TRFO_07684 [Tritrichomonas foetus]|uniref:Right handed beta helix domain-containing protein n=1 Tax=Tritrichomonas foetus TaxID=1144522 RepID=A0A1J4JRF3_9EUKA|nr:hypothetical protein TRFO_07684 [Tritrichomonas foetus]|eukprot:OHT01016.1 hypothetical protein TRFO_07684 [Tritrichomonas foetus]
MLGANLTIYGLLLSNIYAPAPMYSNVRSLSMINTKIRYFYNPIMFNCQKIILQSSFFTNSLASVIRVNSDLEKIQNRNISTRISDFSPNVTSLFVNNCIFSNIESNESGGAIYFVDTSVGVTITRSTFQNCLTSSSDVTNARGGALFLNVESATFAGLCFINCTGSIGQSFYVETKAQYFVHLSEISVIHCNHKNQTLANQPMHIGIGDITAVFVNSSNNIVTNNDDSICGFYLFSEIGNITVAYSNVLNSDGGSSFYFQGGVPHQLLYLSNIFNVTSKSENPTLFFSGLLLVQSCAFINTGSAPIVKPLMYSAVEFYRCEISAPLPESGQIINAESKFGVKDGRTLRIHFPLQNECKWAGYDEDYFYTPTPIPTEKHLTKGAIAGITIGCCVFVIIITIIAVVCIMKRSD